MARKQSFSDKFWYDKHGHFVVWQKPNFLLWTWAVATALNIIAPEGFLVRITSFLGGLAILIWAVMELGWGVNYFRRSLGLGIILLFIVSHFL